MRQSFALLPLLAGCVEADRLVLDADIDARRGEVDVEYRVEGVWHEQVGTCETVATCAGAVGEMVDDLRKGLTEDGARDLEAGARLRGEELDLVTRFTADLDNAALFDEVDELVLVDWSRGDRPGRRAVLVEAPAPGSFDGGELSVEVTGKHERIAVAAGKEAGRTLYLMRKGRSHATLTWDFTGTDKAARADRTWPARTEGLDAALAGKELLLR